MAAAQTLPAAQMLSPGQVLPEPEVVPQTEEEWRQNYNIHLWCHECREFPPNLVEEFSSGDTVCGSCGLVLGDRIVDTRSEWRTFANDESGGDDPSRVGIASNSLIPGPQLETEIQFKRGDGNRSRELTRIHAKATHDKSHKNLKEVFAKISAIGATLHLSDVIVTASQQLYKASDEANAVKGKSTDAILAGCIYIACRQLENKMSFKEIQGVTNISKRDIGRTFKQLQKWFIGEKDKILKAKAAGKTPRGPAAVFLEAFTEQTSSTNAVDICSRYCDALVLDKASTKVAIALAERMKAKGALAGRSPLSTAAACIYFASHLMGNPKTPKEIAVVAKVSDGTIRTSYKNLMKTKDDDDLIDPEWLGEGKGDLKRLPSP